MTNVPCTGDPVLQKEVVCPPWMRESEKGIARSEKGPQGPCRDKEIKNPAASCVAGSK